MEGVAVHSPTAVNPNPGAGDFSDLYIEDVTVDDIKSAKIYEWSEVDPTDPNWRDNANWSILVEGVTSSELEASDFEFYL